MLCRYEVSAVSNTEDLFNCRSSISCLYMILDIVTKIPNRKWRCNIFLIKKLQTYWCALSLTNRAGLQYSINKKRDKKSLRGIVMLNYALD